MLEAIVALVPAAPNRSSRLTLTKCDSVSSLERCLDTNAEYDDSTIEALSR